MSFELVVELQKFDPQSGTWKKEYTLWLDEEEKVKTEFAKETENTEHYRFVSELGTIYTLNLFLFNKTNKI